MSNNIETFLVICIKSDVAWFTVGEQYHAENDPIDGEPLIMQDDLVSDFSFDDAWVAFRIDGEIVISEKVKFKEDSNG